MSRRTSGHLSIDGDDEDGFQKKSFGEAETPDRRSFASREYSFESPNGSKSPNTRVDIQSQETDPLLPLSDDDNSVLWGFLPISCLPPLVRSFMVRQFTRQNGYVLLLLVLCIALGTVNRVVYKIQLTPMENYAIFISDLLSIAYTMVYFSIFFIRSLQGYITPDMYRWSSFPYFDPRFIVMGFCDATGQVLGIFSARKITGFLLTLLPQSIVPMTMLLTIFLLRTKYNLGQVAGAAILIGGVIFTLMPDIIHGKTSGAFYWALIYLVSVFPNAVSFTLKEMVFASNPKTDIFVVNSFDSIFQLLFSLLYLPIVGIPGFGGVDYKDMGPYIRHGFSCLVGHSPTPEDDCFGMPWATMIYISVNLSWNISILLLVKKGGAVLTFIALAVSLPIANLAFIFDWPLLKGRGFDPWDLGALVTVLLGLVVYRYFSMLQKRKMALEKAEAEARRPLPDDQMRPQEGMDPSLQYDPVTGSFKSKGRSASDLIARSINRDEVS